MAVEDHTSITTSLLTLLNVSATKSGSRKDAEDVFVPSEKLNKRKSPRFSESEPTPEKDLDQAQATTPAKEDPIQDEADDALDVTNAYELHFGNSPSVLTESSRAAADSNSWTTSTSRAGLLGTTVVSLPAGSATSEQKEPSIDILDRLRTPFAARQSKQPKDSRKSSREAIALHAINHVTKCASCYISEDTKNSSYPFRKRRRVLKNNEKLAHAAKANPNAEPPQDVQDQGFTRPSILFLLPFRSSALDWYHAITSHTRPPSFQIENQARFTSEYGLPAGAIDKLAEAEPGTYPPDHVETFKGNVDDNFRVGVKLTRKSVKMFAEFYGCDVILASPLGLRRSIEKEKNADYLSSIEILVVDQLDALSMQNWEHVKFVLSHLNQLPKESHDTDFSRLRPWYLDGHAKYLRQSIFLAAYETPEARALYNNALVNVAGKIRTQKHWSPVSVPEGIQQNFVHFDCANPKDEADKRFHHFTTQ
ncbi:hypothetical protein H0H93_009927, partial [Arthromyces matolae]